MTYFVEIFVLQYNDQTWTKNRLILYINTHSRENNNPIIKQLCEITNKIMSKNTNYINIHITEIIIV